MISFKLKYSRRDPTVTISLPIHFRYQLPSRVAYTKVYINPPLIYLSCLQDTKQQGSNFEHFKHHTPPESELLDVTNIHSRTGWIKLTPQDNEKYTTKYRLVTEIPTGQIQLEWTITSITILVTVTGSIVVLYVVFRTAEKNKRKIKLY
jgi:hypothetical protein